MILFWKHVKNSNSILELVAQLSIYFLDLFIYLFILERKREKAEEGRGRGRERKRISNKLPPEHGAQSGA